MNWRQTWIGLFVRASRFQLRPFTNARRAGSFTNTRIMWDMHDARIFRNLFKESKASWARTKRGFELLQTQYPESLAVVSEYCYLSTIAGDRPTAKALFAKLDGKVDQTVWKERERFVENRQWAFA